MTVALGFLREYVYPWRTLKLSFFHTGIDVLQFKILLVIVFLGHFMQKCGLRIPSGVKMINLLQTFSDWIGRDSVFWFCALSGSSLFVIQCIFSLFGADAHESMDAGGGEIDSGQFKWLSKQALTGFLMMFGWVGLTCRKESNFSVTVTFIMALAGGLLAVFITGVIFRLAKKLRSSGTVFRLEDAIGKEAMVYQRIPKQGIGKVSLSLYNLAYEVDAISYHLEELPSFTRVQILKKENDNTVVVVPIK